MIIWRLLGLALLTALAVGLPGLLLANVLCCEPRMYP